MQQGNAKKKSKLKTALWWIFLTAAGVPITKLVESHYNVSYVSSATSALWDWLVAGFAWFAQPVQMPLWLIIMVLVGVACVIIFLISIARELAIDLKSVSAKLNPSLPVLNENAQKVLAVVAAHANRNAELYASEIPEAAGLSRLVCEGAADVLIRERLIQIYHHGWGNQVVLTASGRAYVLHPEAPFAVVG
jgi:hypothetical protein